MATSAIRLTEAVERFLAYRQANYAKSTWENDCSVLRRWSKSVGDIQVRNLRPHHVDEWFFGPKGLTRTLTQPSSFNNYRKRINAFTTYCQRAGWLRGDVLINVRPRKELRRERLRLTASELTGLLDLAGNARDRAYLAISINTALRQSEIISLEVQDVDLDKGELTVEIQKTSEMDLMPITAELDAELRRWLTTYANDIGTALESRMRLIPGWVGPRYTEVKDQRGVRKHRYGPWKPYTKVNDSAAIVQRALKAMGHETRYEGSHTIRRSLARLYFDDVSNKGYDGALRATSALLHHKDATTTERYLGISAERELRNETLRGKPFLSSLVASKDNVVPLPTRVEPEGS